MRFEQKVDSQFTNLSQQLTETNQRLNKLEIGQSQLSGEIKTLDQKVVRIGKRMDNQELISPGILVSVIIALIGDAAKLFDILPLNKSQMVFSFLK